MHDIPANKYVENNRDQRRKQRYTDILDESENTRSIGSHTLLNFSRVIVTFLSYEK